MENIDQSIYERADEGEKLGVEKGRKNGIEKGEFNNQNACKKWTSYFRNCSTFEPI